MDRRLTCLSTFTGLGGMDLGLEAAGFDTVACVEWDEWARRSIKANRGDSWNLLPEGDIEAVAATLRPSDLGLQVGSLDLLAGAPPCQPYSKAGQWADGARRGLADRRGQYLDDHLKLLERFQPKVAIMENVRGFISGRTSALGYIEDWLRANPSTAGRYQIHAEVLDAVDYGVPQLRARAIIVLTRMDVPFAWPVPQPRTNAWDAIGADDFGEPAPMARGKWADLLPTIPEGQNYLHHTSPGGGEGLFGYRTRYWSFLLKLAKDRPSWTLPAQPGPSTGPFHWDNRPLRIQELLRLQSFPVEWVVEGSSRVDKVKQVGNATPPLLAEVLGRSVRSHITGEPVTDVPLTHALQPAGPPPPAATPAPLPERFLSDIRTYDDHPGPGLGPGALARLQAIESSD